MKKWNIPCKIDLSQAKYINDILTDYTVNANDYGFYCLLSTKDISNDDDFTNAVITLFMDEEYINLKRGKKRGPQLKKTNIPVEEMLRLKEEGMPPEEIAEIAGIGVATLFRRIAQYKSSLLD